MRRKLYIYDEDEIYIKRLTKGLEEKGDCPYSIYGFTDFEAYEENLKKSDGLYICDERAVLDLRDRGEDDVVILTANKNSVYENKFIYKYEGITKFLDEVMQIDKSIYERKGQSFNIGKQNSELITVFSPGDLPGATKASLKICEKIKSSKRVLYMNITALPTYIEEPMENTLDIEELLYLSQNDREISKETIMSCVTSINGIDSISVGTHTMEYPTIKGETWQALIQDILDKSGYDTLVLELDGGIQGLIEILRKSNQPFYYMEKDEEFTYQKNRFLDYLRSRNEDGLLNNMKILSNLETGD